MSAILPESSYSLWWLTVGLTFCPDMLSEYTHVYERVKEQEEKRGQINEKL